MERKKAVKVKGILAQQLIKYIIYKSKNKGIEWVRE